MASSDPDDPVNTLPLNQLILYVKKRDGMTLRKLVRRAEDRGCEDCTQSQLSWLTYKPMKEYPRPSTIESVAAALDLTYEQVLNACTRQLGRPHVWRGTDGGATVLVDDDITPEQAEDYSRRVERAARKK